MGASVSLVDSVWTLESVSDSLSYHLPAVWSWESLTFLICKMEGCVRVYVKTYLVGKFQGISEIIQ